MRLGIRLQLVLALGSLLVLTLVPLFFAVASLTRATVAQARVSGAVALGRVVARHAMDQPNHRNDPPDAPRPTLEAQVGQEGVSAIGLYDASGALVMRAGDPSSQEQLPRSVVPGVERITSLRAGRATTLLVVAPGEQTAAAVIVRVDPASSPMGPLLRLVALYTGTIALALLVLTYASMTRLVVRPIDGLSQAARRVAEGARGLVVPKRGAAELIALGSSLTVMTERMRADEEALRRNIVAIQRYTEDFKRMQEGLVRSERLASVGRLAAGLAHEIGNPIAAIVGLQELLQSGGLSDAEQKDYLARMKRETERVSRILRDLLDFARPTAPRAIEPAGAVHEALVDVAALVRPQRAFRDLAIVLEVAPDLPAVALSHPRLVQILLNLLLNAADAAPQHGGRITVRASRISSSRVRLEVEDNGGGIAPEVRDRLFEPFVTTKGIGRGTGLGLAVCRGLLEAVGGTIGVDQGQEGGARFVMELPVCSAS